MTGRSAEPSKRAGLAVAWNAFGMAAILAAPAAVVAFPRSAEVAIVLGPGASAAQTIETAARAGGSIVRMGASPSMAIVTTDRDPEDFILGLYRAGAWLVLDPIVMGGCQPVRTPSPNGAAP